MGSLHGSVYGLDRALGADLVLQMSAAFHHVLSWVQNCDPIICKRCSSGFDWRGWVASIAAFCVTLVATIAYCLLCIMLQL